MENKGKYLTFGEICTVVDDINASYSDTIYDVYDEGGAVFKSTPALIAETDGCVVNIKIFGNYMWNSVDAMGIESIDDSGEDERVALHSYLLMYIREFGNLINQFNMSGLDS